MRVFQDSRGVGFEVDLPNSEPGRALGEAVKRGDLSQMSFGFVTTGDRWEQYGAGLLRTVTSARLSEISAVAFPAYPQTRVSVAGNSTPLEANRAAADLDLKFRRLAIARLR
jgi:HK97 family phage prohead protease